MKQPLYKLFIMSLAFTTNVAVSQQKIDIQGHRGCRGLMPENTIPAFIRALVEGVNTIELDVVVTSDNKVLVSHEPYMSATICTKADGTEITEASEKKHNIYKMSYAETQQYDCGKKVHPRFPEQQKIAVSKPLLEDAIDAIEAHISKNKLKPVKYNIEIKSTRRGDNKFHPAPEQFAKLVVEIVRSKGITDRTIIQSFDVRSIQAVKKYEPKITISYLIANANSLNKNLKKSGFKPDYYSPYFMLLNTAIVKKAKEQSIKIAVWTVNDEADMKKMIAMGVDAIITDFPDKLSKILNGK